MLLLNDESVTDDVVTTLIPAPSLQADEITSNDSEKAVKKMKTDQETGE